MNTKLCDDGFCMRHSATKKKPGLSAEEKLKRFEINADEEDIIKKLNMVADSTFGDMGVVLGQEQGIRINGKKLFGDDFESPNPSRGVVPERGETVVNIMPREIKTKKEVVEETRQGDLYKEVTKEFDPLEYGDMKPVLKKKKKKQHVNVSSNYAVAEADSYPDFQKILDSIGSQIEISPEVKREYGDIGGEGLPDIQGPGINQGNLYSSGNDDDDDDDEMDPEEIKKKIAHQKMISAIAYQGYKELVLGRVEKSFPRYRGIKDYFAADTYTKSIWADSFLEVCTDLGVDLSCVKSYHMLLMGQAMMFMTYKSE